MSTQPRIIDIPTEVLVDLAAGIPQLQIDMYEGWSVGITSDQRTPDEDYGMFTAANVETLRLTDEHLVDLIAGREVFYAGPGDQGYQIRLCAVEHSEHDDHD